MHSGIPPYVYIIFTAVTAIGVLIQAGVLLGMFLALLKTQKKGEQLLRKMEIEALPIIASTRVALEDLSPKLKVITANLVEVTETLKYETKHIKGSVDDVLERTRAQTARVDEMVSGTLDGLSHASATIQHGISVPLRQINGVLNGFRAGMDVLLHRRSGDGVSGYRYPSKEEEEILNSGVSE